jgi:hypothetical protein
MSPDENTIRFVRALRPGARAIRRGRYFETPDGLRAPAAVIRRLLSAGALSGSSEECGANSETRGWLRRALLEPAEIAGQHRLIRQVGAVAVNLAESPLGRLGAPGPNGGEPFLAPHQVEAGERVRRLVERARLMPRTTMTYSASRVVRTTESARTDLSDMALDARREIAKLRQALPEDCAAVVMDVCGLLKGLQQVEQERGWPRRSAKLVLRIGLETLAGYFGLSPTAIGHTSEVSRNWMADGARPRRFE